MGDGDPPIGHGGPGGELCAGTAELAAFVRDRQGAIIAEWVRQARAEIESAATVDESTLVDHVPPLLARIADVSLALGRGESAPLPYDLAETHAESRLAASFGLGEVVGEYALLRSVILRMWEREHLPKNRWGALPALNVAIDRSVAASIDHYVRAQHRALAALRDEAERRAREAESALARSRQLEEAERRSAEQAHRLARQREEFMTVVSHDLRNPLGAVSLAANVLGTQLAGVEPAVKRQIEVILRAVGRMERLIGDLLDVARLEAGAVALHLESHDVEGVLGEAVMFHEPMAHASGIDLTCEVADGTGAIVCDRERIQQVLANLLGNAEAVCGPGDRITVSARPEGDGVRVIVRDTGPGVPEEMKGRLFEPYQSGPARQNGAGGGTGLGLYIARGIVETHGGTMGFESEPGGGSTFWFVLPRSGPRRSAGERIATGP